MFAARAAAVGDGRIGQPVISWRTVLELRPVPEDGSRPSLVEGLSWRDAWDRMVAADGSGGFLQLWGWGDHAARFGAIVERWALVSEGRVLGAAQVLVEKARAGMMASVPHGPVCPSEPDIRSAMFEQLRIRYRGRAVALRFEPAWPDSQAARRDVAAAGLRPSTPLQPRSTSILDLLPDVEDGEAALLERMHQKCRYNIRLSARKGVGVELCGPEALEDFEAMLEDTARRHGLTQRPRGYHASAYRAFEPSGVALFAARFEAETLGMIMVVRCGDRATYLYGASTERERGRMPNHALQWRAITDARAAGCRSYDFWGIPDEIGARTMRGEDPESIPEGQGGLWGVWRFKRGFGGHVERRVGRWDDVLAPVRYLVGVSAPAALRRFRGGAAGAR